MAASKILSLLLLAIFFVPTSDVLPLPAPVSPKAVHKIELSTALGANVCTAAAIAPRALLTAGHCDMGTDVVKVDGHEHRILQRLFDGHDHMILIVDGDGFVDVLPLTPRNASSREPVYSWGFPGNRTEAVYRSGYFEGMQKGMEIFSLPAFPGDSGSPILDVNGRIIAVVSMADQEAEVAALPLSFSAQQMKLVS